MPLTVAGAAERKSSIMARAESAILRNERYCGDLAKTVSRVYRRERNLVSLISCSANDVRPMPGALTPTEALAECRLTTSIIERLEAIRSTDFSVIARARAAISAEVAHLKTIIPVAANV